MIKALRRLADRTAKTPRRLWLASFALFFALAAAWSAATPLGGSPDEHAHFIRAAAVARGQIGGPEVMVPHNVAGIEGQFAETGVQLPAWYAQLPTVHECYSWHVEKPASCAPKLGHAQQTVQVTTAAGRYNPVYYLAVGWPSLLVEGPHALYLMRFVSAGLVAALLASAVVTATEWRRRSATVLGVLAAATPTALYMGGMVNPSGGEIAAGILVWSAALAILLSPDPLLLNRRLTRLGVGGAVLINIRPLGLIWFVGAIALSLVLHKRGSLQGILRRKILWIWTAVLTASAVVSLLWAQAHPDHSVIHVPANLTTIEGVKLTFYATSLYVQQMIGYFGWLDTPSPGLTQIAWMFVLGVLVLLALAFGGRRAVFALVAMMVAIVVVPVAAQASQVEKLGLVWQGRYLLPFAVGLSLMAGAIWADRAPDTGPLWRRLTGYAAIALALANAGAFYWTLRRFTVGTSGSWVPRVVKWSPPIGWELWAAVYTGAALALALLALLSDRVPPEEAGTGHSAPAAPRRRSRLVVGR